MVEEGGSRADRLLYVATDGDDANAGTLESPFATLARARDRIRTFERVPGARLGVRIRSGTYYLAEALEFGPADSGLPGSPIIWEAAPGEAVTLSGGVRLDCVWQPWKEGIFRCLPTPRAGAPLDFDQLFINGKRQTRARWPKRDDSAPKEFTGYARVVSKIGAEEKHPAPGPNDDMTFSGAAPRGLVFDPAEFAPRPWARPEEAVVHVFQAFHWGNMQWRVKKVDREGGRLWFGEGGWQMGAKWSSEPCEIDGNSRYFVENLLEELDSPGEWYFDCRKGVLYFKPPADLDLATALVEVPILTQALRLRAQGEEPVHDIAFKGFRFAHTGTTFLEAYSAPSRSDWSLHRGGTAYFEGTRDCSLEDCFFDAVGGNAVFLHRYNRGAAVRGCLFAEAGDSAVCLVGSYEDTLGTQRHFPFECVVEDNEIGDCGVFGKQTAGIYISRAKRIRASRNSISKMPRAGICIGDGTWGGHLIEDNLIRDTCRETGDHGPFNAWGRDMYWCPVQSHGNYTPGRSHDAGSVKDDAMEPVVVRHNRFEEISGWGLDLDDGASNYEIYDNLCVGVSIKLREGAYRTIYNNIWVNGANSPCFHVGNENNHDRYFRNITVMTKAAMKPENDLNFSMSKGYGEVYTLIAPPSRGPWLEEVDHNCLWSDLGEFVARMRDRDEGEEHGGRKRRKLGLDEWRELGFDRNSVFADPLFVDPARGDYRVRPESPALGLGFRNFSMEGFGAPRDLLVRWARPQS